jgi:aldehyde dehydrogenase (NAD+)
MKDLNSYQTTLAEASISFQRLRKFFDEGKSLDINFRKQALKTLYREIEANQEKICEAAVLDFNKPKAEMLLTEIYPVLADIKHTLAKLDKWIKPERRSANLLVLPSSSKIYKSPKGVVLIIAPWNYAFYLSILPLISAIAAGNVAILKPAHETFNLSLVIKDIVSKSFHDDHVTVVTGEGKSIGDMLMDNFVFNHIFFTGSPGVGKVIMTKAANNLTPVTLELGGKSPAIIEKGYDLERAAKKIIWSKFINAGQTCVAPDYVILHRDDKLKFIEISKKVIVSLFGEDPLNNREYCHLITDARFDKVLTYLSQGEILYGGKHDKTTRAIEPTIIIPNSLEEPIMKEEIFGPILPILEYNQNCDVVDIIRLNRYPLALYLFNETSEFKNTIYRKVEFGGGCQHNAIYHLGNPNLPFGGIQTSGIGNYHGYEGFLAFSNTKSVLNSAKWFDLKLYYQPYTEGKFKIIRKFFGI